MRLLIISTLLLLTGCKAIKEAREERKEQKVVEWNLLHPEKAAEYCATNFPCSVDTITVTEERFDTIIKEGVIVDTFIRTETDTVLRKVSVKCPPVQVITKTEKVTSYVPVIDSARSTVYRLQNRRLQEELVLSNKERDEWKVKAKSRLWMFIAGCALILGLIAVIIAILKGKNKL